MAMELPFMLVVTVLMGAAADISSIAGSYCARFHAGRGLLGFAAGMGDMLRRLSRGKRQNRGTAETSSMRAAERRIELFTLILGAVGALWRRSVGSAGWIRRGDPARRFPWINFRWMKQGVGRLRDLAGPAKR